MGRYINSSSASATPRTTPSAEATAIIDLPKCLSSHFSNFDGSPSSSKPSISADAVIVDSDSRIISTKLTMPRMTGMRKNAHFSFSGL